MNNNSNDGAVQSAEKWAHVLEIRRVSDSQQKPMWRITLDEIRERDAAIRRMVVEECAAEMDYCAHLLVTDRPAYEYATRRIRALISKPKL